MDIETESPELTLELTDEEINSIILDVERDVQEHEKEIWNKSAEKLRQNVLNNIEDRIAYLRRKLESVDYNDDDKAEEMNFFLIKILELCKLIKSIENIKTDEYEPVGASEKVRT